MPDSFDYLLLGGGTACGYAAAALREVDREGSVGIVGAETEPPYNRPPFSKKFLTDDTFVPSDAHNQDESFYRDNGVELLLGCRAVGLDRRGRTVELEGGRKIGYGKLLYALGSAAKPLEVEGGGEVMLLRSAGDAELIRSAAKGARSALIVGGGYIGCEVAASLLKVGLDVTLLEIEDRIWPGVPSKAAGEAVRRQLQSMGAEVVTGEGAGAVGGGTPMSVTGTSGRKYAADMVVAGVGAVPGVSLAKEAGLPLGERGVKADSSLRTEDPHIWVAGDVAEYEDVVLGKPFHAEHHMHAKWTGGHAGRAMAGEAGPHRNAPYFFSDVGDLSMILRGYLQHAARSFVIGDPSEPVFTEVCVTSEGHAIGMLDMRRDFKAQDPINDLFEKLILSRTDLSAHLDDFAKPGFDVMSLQALVVD
ncbi:MAG: FAD-dependent oxidoreductase [Armatimonadetes bacterium]|nr:FAD-dependent oxidoreductase [Armatimonadota bacterium]